MFAQEIQALVRVQPFVPFRIHVQGGPVYDIIHPEGVMVTLWAVFIGIRRTGKEAEPHDKVDIVNVQQIARVEQMVPVNN